ncbi:SCO7613 C-terminal domain-containing membrane protein, partial [Micromonospora wenchangensis]|uniref:SCO7613 C-terminal domain-containing membrane protein n=1 Tax=Micromonospora wenchangensis TaxID=1185415 RepID=UPI003477A847
ARWARAVASTEPRPRERRASWNDQANGKIDPYLRARPGLTSWLALGPGLAAGLLPSLVSVLVAPDPQPWRRLLLGGAALGVVLVGAVRRWQAPVVLGGGALVLLAVHELVRGWDLLPRWIYLAVGGLALITLAATYERRRRDVARLRAAVGRMG